jgi:hypothetical protein
LRKPLLRSFSLQARVGVINIAYRDFVRDADPHYAANCFQLEVGGGGQKANLILRR